MKQNAYHDKSNSTTTAAPEITLRFCFQVQEHHLVACYIQQCLAIHRQQVYTSGAVISKRMSENSSIRKRLEICFLERFTKWIGTLKQKIKWEY